MKHILKPAIILFSTAVIVATLVSVAHWLTAEPIASKNQRLRLAAMREVLPQAENFIEFPATLSGDIVRVFQGAPVGYVVELSPEGYSGKINVIVGISSADKSVAGVRILKHTETPGLGSLAASEAFYRKFDNKPLIPLKVVKNKQGDDEIDALTGATITTNAIVDAVNQAIEWYFNRT